MADYSPGEVVVIRDWEDMELEFGLNGHGSIPCDWTFVPDMRRFCGMRVTIASINGNGVVKFIDCPRGMRGYNFSTDMIRYENAPAYSVAEVPVSDFLSLIS